MVKMKMKGTLLVAIAAVVLLLLVGPLVSSFVRLFICSFVLCCVVLCLIVEFGFRFIITFEW